MWSVPHDKCYTTLLPNTGIYDINASTNKCTSGVQGRSKNNVPEYNHYYFPAKKEETPQRFILGTRFLYIFSPYVCLHNKYFGIVLHFSTIFFLSSCEPGSKRLLLRSQKSVNVERYTTIGRLRIS